MRFLPILGVLTLLPACFASAAALHGIIVSDDDARVPVPRTSVQTTGEPAVESDGFGRFALPLPRANPGDRIRIEVSRPGYEVLVPRQLDVTVPDDENSPGIEVLLARAPVRDVVARRFYRRACIDAARRRFRRTDGKEPASTENSRERDLVLRAADSLAGEFARVPAEAMSVPYRLASSHYLNGEDDPALARLAESALLELPRNTEAQETQFVEACLLKGRILTTHGRFDEARAAFGLATREAPGRFAGWLGSALFERSLHRHPAASEGFRKALLLARASADQEGTAKVLLESGHLHREQDRLDDARRAWSEALVLFRRLAAQQPDRFLPEVASVLNDLGNLALDTREVAAAHEAYSEANEIYRGLATADPSAYAARWAALRSNLGIMASLEGDAEAARRWLGEALESQRRLARTHAPTARADLARSCFNLGLLEHRRRRSSAALAAYSEALALYRTLAEDQPTTYSADLGDTLANLGILFRDQGRLVEAARHLREALAAYRIVALDRPDRFGPTLERLARRLQQLESEPAEPQP